MTRLTKLESDFQTDLNSDLERLFPGCLIIKGNSAMRPGIPDRLVLFENRWAALEVKRSATAVHQPNQDWYVELMDRMSFAAFIYPENKEEVLRDLQQAFRARR